MTQSEEKNWVPRFGGMESLRSTIDGKPRRPAAVALKPDALRAVGVGGDDMATSATPHRRRSRGRVKVVPTVDADARYVVVTMPTGFRDRLVSVRVDTGALAAAYPTEELKSLHVGLASRDDAADGTATEDGQVQQDAASVRDYIATLESDD